ALEIERSDLCHAAKVTGQQQPRNVAPANFTQNHMADTGSQPEQGEQSVRAKPIERPLPSKESTEILVHAAAPGPELEIRDPRNREAESCERGIVEESIAFLGREAAHGHITLGERPREVRIEIAVEAPSEQCDSEVERCAAARCALKIEE